MLIDAYRFQPCRIESVVRESEKAVSVWVARPEDYVFQPGQHAVVRVLIPDGSKLVRQYSFSSGPNEASLRLTVVQEGDGIVSSWFNQVAADGDVIELSQPFAGPLMQEITRAKICMIAGGSGIAPLMSHLELRRAEDAFNTTLLYSTRTDELCFSNTLAPLPGESVEIRLTDKVPRFTPEEILTAAENAEAVLICGSRPFVLTMRSICEQCFPADKVHTEAFSL